MDFQSAITGITVLDIVFLILIGAIFVHAHKKGPKKAGV